MQAYDEVWVDEISQKVYDFLFDIIEKDVNR